jgi:hypothetical protein
MSRLSMDRIRAKCIEDGDCLLWTGKKHTKTGAPAGTEWVDGQDKYVGVRRRAYEEQYKTMLTKDDEIVCTCGNPACLEKKHLERVSRSERIKRVHAAMDAGTRLKRNKSLADAMQRMRGKLLPEQVAEIRSSEDGPYVTAKRLGVSGVVASRIKRGISYKNYVRNPFQI